MPAQAKHARRLGLNPRRQVEVRADKEARPAFVYDLLQPDVSQIHPAGNPGIQIRSGGKRREAARRLHAYLLHIRLGVVPRLKGGHPVGPLLQDAAYAADRVLVDHVAVSITVHSGYP